MAYLHPMATYICVIIGSDDWFVAWRYPGINVTSAINVACWYLAADNFTISVPDITHYTVFDNNVFWIIAKSIVVSHQNIIWLNDDPYLCPYVASLGQTDLKKNDHGV